MKFESFNIFFPLWRLITREKFFDQKRKCMLKSKFEESWLTSLYLHQSWMKKDRKKMFRVAQNWRPLINYLSPLVFRLALSIHILSIANRCPPLVFSSWRWKQFFQSANISDDTVSTTYAKAFVTNSFNKLLQLDNITIIITTTTFWRMIWKLCESVSTIGSMLVCHHHHTEGTTHWLREVQWKLSLRNSWSL